MKNIVLQTDSISKNFKSFCALKNVSVTLEKGKVYGLIGKCIYRSTRAVCTLRQSHLAA